MREGLSRRAAIGVIGGAALAATTRAAVAQPMSGAAAQPQSSLPFEEEALNWARRNAKPLDTHDAGIAELRPLVAALGDVQVVGLGDATGGGGHEEAALKAALVRALIVHGGARTLAFELNRRPAGQLDRYLRGGGDPVELLRQPTFPQSWQSEEFLGLVNWIRAWNLAGRETVRIVGIDVQGLGADAWEAFRWLYEVNPNVARPLEAPLAPLFRDERSRDASTADLLRSLTRSQVNQASAALDRLAGLIAAVSRAGKENAAAAAESARQAMQLARADSGTAGSDQNAGARRDRLMADNLLALREGARTIYWGNNLQVAAGRGVGAALRQRLARGYQAVAFEFERGAINVKGSGTATARREEPWQAAEQASGPGGLGTALARLGVDRFWLPLGPAASPPAAWLAHPYRHGSSGTAAGQQALPLAGNFDILVFLRRLTPSRLLPFVPQR
jgi:erythromycin esterase-like protein